MVSGVDESPRGVRRACLLVCALGLTAFALLAADVFFHGSLTAIDADLAADLARHSQGQPALHEFFRWVTIVGDKVVVGGVVAGLALGLYRGGQRRLALLLLSAFISGAVLEWTLKNVFQRARPPLENQIPGYSFPSGHAMTAVLGYGLAGYVAVLVFQRGRATILAGLACLVLAIGFSRMYLQAHFLSDVAAGFAFGTAWLAGWIVILHTERGVSTPCVQDQRATSAAADTVTPPACDNSAVSDA